MTSPTPEELAQVVADHFSPPFRAEDFEYVRDDQGKFARDPKTGFRVIRYFMRDYMDTPESSTMITERIWADGQPDIQIRALTYIEIAKAILDHYNLEKKP